MTIREAIDRADKLVPNGFTTEQKVEWLSTLDKNIFSNVFLTHENPSVTEFHGYNADTDLATELLVDKTYDNLYLYYLFAMFDHTNREYDGYNNNSIMYDNILTNYKAWYTRTHKPITTGREVYF